MAEEQVQEVALNRDETIEAARGNLNFFAALCIPEIFLYLFPAIFLAIWQILTAGIHKEKGKDHLAIGIPRGFGKTILLKLYVVYVVLFTNRRFILVVCNTQQLAENFIADVVDILSSANITSLFGDYRLTLTKDTLALKKFAFGGRPVILAGAGAGTSLRGLNIKYVRPDVIIMDDMQSREEAESAIEAQKTLTWMMGTLYKCASPHRCLYIFVGNMYPFEGSILKKLKYNPVWISFVLAAILEDGESIWPELKSVETLMEELENDTAMGHPEIFYSEVMNDEEAGTRSGVDISAIRGYRSDELPEYHEGGFIIIDPSAGKKKSDDLVIGACLIYNGKPCLRELAVGKFTPKQTIQQAIALALKYEIPAIIVESVAYQATLCFWFTETLAQLGIAGINALEIYPGRNAKNSRILSGFKQLVSGEVLLHADVRSQVTYQITHWNPLKTDNKDDILDIVAYMQQCVKQFNVQLVRILSAQGGFDDLPEAGFSDQLPPAF